MAGPRAVADRRSGARRTCVDTGARPRAAAGTVDSHLDRLGQVGLRTVADRVARPSAVRSPDDHRAARSGGRRRVVPIGLRGLGPWPAVGRSVATARRAVRPGRPDRLGPAGAPIVATVPTRRADPRGAAGTVLGPRLACGHMPGGPGGRRTAVDRADHRGAARPAAVRSSARLAAVRDRAAPHGEAHHLAARHGEAHRGAARRDAIRSRADGPLAACQPRPASTSRRQR
jgi:hypothetical protein